MKKLLAFFLFLPSILFSQSDSLEKLIQNERAYLLKLQTEEQLTLKKIENLNHKKITQTLNTYGLPKSKFIVQVVSHLAMVLAYDENHEQARWVMHLILPDIEYGTVNRTNDFRSDSLVSTGTAEKADYWDSGYDRGHLAPSADFKWSSSALSQSYYYSNMSPQKPELNRERWAELEELLRTYVIHHKRSLIVATGPVLSTSLPKLGKNEISIPNYYYKIAIDPATKNGIGFIMPNKKCEAPVLYYAVSIDSIEKLVEIDFFPNLNKSDEKLIESAFKTEHWKFGKEIGNVEPMEPEKLPKGKFNTIMAKHHIGEKITVCGTVVSTKLVDKSQATYLNLDRQFPNQIFTVQIWKEGRQGFTYAPEVFLNSKKVCVTGKVEDNKGIPTMTLTNEKAVEILPLTIEEE